MFNIQHLHLMIFFILIFQFDTTVLEKRRKILAHPVMQALIDVKWRFIRVYFYLYLAIYILFLLIWSALMSHPTLQEQHIYKFPRDIWRVVLQVLSQKNKNVLQYSKLERESPALKII